MQRDVPTTLGKLAGVNSVKASRKAGAGLGSSQHERRAFPLTICDDQAKAIMSRAISSPYPIEVIDVNKVWKADCSSKNGSGNWGWLDCGGNGTPGLVDAILNGCDIDLTLTGTPPTITVDGTAGQQDQRRPGPQLPSTPSRARSSPSRSTTRSPATAPAPSTAWSASST